MIKYNTQEKPLAMREYGRHIQNLIEYCVNIPDREERTKCANSIARIMASLLSESNNEKVDMHKVWNHINMISGFKLDVDFPCDILEQSDLNPKPSSIPYNIKSEKFRGYGSNIVKMIRSVSKMEPGVEKDQIIFLVANQMKKVLVSDNPETATDYRIFKDIREISGGVIDIDPENYKLNEYIGVATPNEGKKKKKK